MEISLSDEDVLLENLGQEAKDKLFDELELLDGAGAEFDLISEEV